MILVSISALIRASCPQHTGIILDLSSVAKTTTQQRKGVLTPQAESLLRFQCLLAEVKVRYPCSGLTIDSLGLCIFDLCSESCLMLLPATLGRRSNPGT